MTPKQKTVEIFNKYNSIKMSVSRKVQKERVIRCCLLLIEEILNAIDWHEFESPNKEIEFWEEVKTEIEKL